MNLLFIGDIVGKGGRKAVKELVPELRQKYNCSFCIANAENSAGGSGITGKCIRDLSSVVDVITLGDHVWDQKGFENEINMFKNVVRPANLSRQQPGSGYGVFRNPGGGEIAVINLQGKVFMKDSAYCPFETAADIIKKIPKTVSCIVVDIHAEATSEKAAIAHFLDGQVTAVLGTHTHVQTADHQILPGQTAFITDVGMTGAAYSVLGRSVSSVIQKFSTGMPRRLIVEEKGIRLDAVVVSYDLKEGYATAIKPLSLMSSI